MSAVHQRRSRFQVQEREIECKPFGGYDPCTLILALSVEAPTVDGARIRMETVAALLGIERVDGLVLLEMARPYREAPLFTNGYFEAIWQEVKQAI